MELGACNDNSLSRFVAKMIYLKARPGKAAGEIVVRYKNRYGRLLYPYVCAFQNKRFLCNKATEAVTIRVSIYFESLQARFKKRACVLLLRQVCISLPKPGSLLT